MRLFIMYATTPPMTARATTAPTMMPINAPVNSPSDEDDSPGGGSGGGSEGDDEDDPPDEDGPISDEPAGPLRCVACPSLVSPHRGPPHALEGIHYHIHV